jgi:hypothetical protein
VFLNTDWVTVNVAPILINNSESDKKKIYFHLVRRIFGMLQIHGAVLSTRTNRIGSKKVNTRCAPNRGGDFRPKISKSHFFPPFHFSNIASQFVRNGREQLTPTVKTWDTIGIFLRRFLFKLI